MFQHIKDLVELDDSGPKVWKLLRDVIQPNTLPMVILLEELAALSMRPGDDVKLDQWTPERLRQQILQEDFRRRHTKGGAANKTTKGYAAAGGSRGRRRGRGQRRNLKHMGQRYAWLQHMVRRGKFMLKYILTTEQPADFVTKALHFPEFNRCSVAID
ncbi:unnamed protein product [Closterium sp. NIES-53]